MPYIIKKVKNGFKLCKKDEPDKCFSNKPITKKKAIAQMKAIGISEHIGSGKEEQYNLLELFKGTGSVGKVAKKMKMNVVSLDNEAKYKPDILTDILKWDYKKFYNETGFIPDFIWASPPCNTFSIAVIPLRERDHETAEPISERAKLGTKILYRTLTIINFFKKLNPDLLFVLENPLGMMRKDKKIKKLNVTTTLYCNYGDDRYKRTDFFSNFDLKLNDKKQCPEDVKLRGIQDINKLEEKYYIPPKLIKSILSQFIENY